MLIQAIKMDEQRQSKALPTLLNGKMQGYPHREYTGNIPDNLSVSVVLMIENHRLEKHGSLLVVKACVEGEISQA